MVDGIGGERKNYSDLILSDFYFFPVRIFRSGDGRRSDLVRVLVCVH